MPRFKLTLEYEGTAYAGWQVQKNAKTVQGELINAVKSAFNTKHFELYGAGRTDAGVHASGQVAHLDVPTQHPPERILMILNDRLPQDINLLAVEEVAPDFHARHSAVSRHYAYHISRRRTVFGRRTSWWVREPLNTEAMQAAAAHLVGFHDFRAFGQPSTGDESTLVNLTCCALEFPDNDRIVIRVEGSHFLWKMVRRIVGTLVEVGRGKLTPEAVEAILREGEPSAAAPYTAPASGLFLSHVEYNIGKKK